MDDENTAPLTEKQKMTFSVITSGEYIESLALLSGKFMGQDVAYVISIDDRNPDQVIAAPLAIICEPAFFKIFGKDMADSDGNALISMAAFLSQGTA